jgi:hypothetical protein
MFKAVLFKLIDTLQFAAVQYDRNLNIGDEAERL